MSCEIVVRGKTLPEAYHEALRWLDMIGAEQPCSDWNTTQKEISLTMVVEEPLAEPMISKLFIGGPKDLQQYCMEMLDGILDFEVEKGNWSYTYHSRMAEQIPLVIAELRRNPDSRRAVIDIRDWQVDMGSSDPACLQHIQYFIRNGHLDCKVLFRSNDACKAAFMNAFVLIMLQRRIAEALDVRVGEYTHRANSFHCYARDYELLRGYIKRMYDAKENSDVAYRYEYGWDELMVESIPEIMKMVDELKGR